MRGDACLMHGPGRSVIACIQEGAVLKQVWGGQKDVGEKETRKKNDWLSRKEAGAWFAIEQGADLPRAHGGENGELGGEKMFVHAFYKTLNALCWT